MDRNNIIVKISRLLLFSGFIMEILSILMFYGLIWSNVGRIGGSCHNIWPIIQIDYCMYCTSCYGSAFYFPFFMFGFIFIISATTMLTYQLLTKYYIRFNRRKETLNDKNDKKMNCNERRLEEIETYYDKLANNKNHVVRRLLLVLLIISIIILTSIMFFEYASVIIPRPKPPITLSVYDDRFDWPVIILVLIIIALFISSFIVLSYKEYWEYITYRHPSINKGYHTLSIDDLFENENRKKIIKTILEEPGIHNNELLRRCNLQKGQLQWHLQVLVQYNIIKKEKIGQYSTFFPSLNKIAQENNHNLVFSKSKTFFKILNMIEDNPGINSSKIASNLNLNKSSVKYHVDRFIEEKMISCEKNGHIIRLYEKKE